MKTKVLLIAAIAITLLSFTVVSSRNSSKGAKAAAAGEQHGGFALQDANQF